MENQGQFNLYQFSSLVYYLTRAGQGNQNVFSCIASPRLLCCQALLKMTRKCHKMKRDLRFSGCLLAFYLGVHMMLSINAERANTSKQTKSIPHYIVPHGEEMYKFLYVVSCEVQQKKDSIDFERVKYPCEKLLLAKKKKTHFRFSVSYQDWKFYHLQQFTGLQ